MIAILEPLGGFYDYGFLSEFHFTNSLTISMMKGVANSTPTKMPWANSLMVILRSPLRTARNQGDQGHGSQGG
jgi:hypothetical protein